MYQIHLFKTCVETELYAVADTIYCNFFPYFRLFRSMNIFKVINKNFDIKLYILYSFFGGRGEGTYFVYAAFTV